MTPGFQMLTVRLQLKCKSGTKPCGAPIELARNFKHTLRELIRLHPGVQRTVLSMPALRDAHLMLQGSVVANNPNVASCAFSLLSSFAHASSVRRRRGFHLKCRLPRCETMP
jgi:hypothetical protein